MSRRKQANPRSFKLTDEMKLIQKEMISNGFLETKLEPKTSDDSQLKDKDEIKIKVERTSRSSSVDSLIDSSCETKCINNENIKDETTANETTVKLNDLDDDHVDANGNASRQHLKQQQQNEQKQTSILINGKRYYPLIFPCDSCGLRYSDQSTLMTHKQNYCSSRRQTSSTRSSSVSSSSTRSSSVSPSRPSLCSTDDQNSTSSESDEKPNKLETKFSNIEIENKQDKQERTQVKPTSPVSLSGSTTAAITQNSDNQMQLVKSVIFQCNSCLFQTDKKSIMNRHSRVHLAQKRKAMEESSSTVVPTSSPSGSADLIKENLTAIKRIKNDCTEETSKKNEIKKEEEEEATNSYCKDCDIKFSSASTYQHHRNNYCQKYKTIEAVVALDSNKTGLAVGVKQLKQPNQTSNDVIASTGNKPPSEILKPTVQLSKTTDTSSQISNSFYLPSYQRSPSPSMQTPPPGAVQMGDLVYIPVYKVSQKKPHQFFSNNMLPTIVPKENSAVERPMTRPVNNSESEIVLNQMKMNSNSPLDLSLNQQNQVKLNSSYSSSCSPLPLKLNPTNLVIQPNLDASFIYQQALAKQQQQQLLYYKEKELEYLNRKLQSDSYMKLTMPYRFPFDSYQTAPNFPMPVKQPLEPFQNKIYHCTKCQQLFFKLKLFKRHGCVTNIQSNLPVELNIEPVRSKQTDSTDSRKNSPVSSADSSFDKTNDKQLSPNAISNDIKKATFGQISLEDGLLKHPLVKKTIQEMYESEDSKQLALEINRNFFICTTCGYRGNTLRGVKQHGKLHLSGKEQFAIINMAEKEPLLAYNSAEDNEIQIQFSLNGSQLQNGSQKKQPIADKTRKRFTSNVKDETDSNDDSTEKNSACKIPLLLLTNSDNNSKKPTATPATAVPASTSAIPIVTQPISKKARLLDSHYSQQKMLIDETKKQENETDTSMPENSSTINSHKSQTYCSKCDIQFQQISNYLAHKNNYCKT